MKDKADISICVFLCSSYDILYKVAIKINLITFIELLLYSQVPLRLLTRKSITSECYMSQSELFNFCQE